MGLQSCTMRSMAFPSFLSKVLVDVVKNPLRKPHLYETIMKIHKMALGRNTRRKKHSEQRERERERLENGRRKVLKIPIHAESTCFNAPRE